MKLMQFENNTLNQDFLNIKNQNLKRTIEN